MCEYSHLNTVDKNGGIHHFIYAPPEEDRHFGANPDQASAVFIYRIKTAIADEHSFEFSVQDISRDSFRVVMMENHLRKEYTSKGIPEAMIILLARTCGKTVTSSSNLNGAEEFRTCPASKIWDRLVAKGLARYSTEEDRYYAI